MEIDLTETRWANTASLIAATLVSLVLLGALGRTVTPANNGILTWTEWQVFQGERAYRRELTQLQQAMDTLVSFYEAGQRDPVRGQYVAAKVEALLGSQKMAVLDKQRQAVLDAADAVRQWSLGVLSDDDARRTLERATHAVDR